MNKQNDFNKNEEESLNNTFDSVDVGNKDLRTEYLREFNKTTPNFKGLPKDYYPTTCGTFIISCLMLFPIYIVCTFLFWGLLEWGLHDKETFGYVGIGIFVLYMVIILTSIFIGSADRKKKERDFIAKKIAEQREEKEVKKIEGAKYREFLNKYMKMRTESGIIRE